MLPRDRAELIVAEHAGGKSIREIAEAHGHSITTIRDYVRGRRTPGEPAARDDEFVPYIAYCRRRLADDPHLRTPALLAELSVLGFDGSRATFYRALERHGIQTHPCPDCHPASMSGYSPPSPGRNPQPFPLPKPAAPVAGETLTSFLGRLAAVNRTSPGALLDILPHWFRVKARWHDDRWQPARLIPRADDAAARLAVISGSTTAAIKAALPAFGGKRSRPLRAAIACRLCTAARGIQQPVPVHLPAHQQLCIRHGIWLPGRKHRSSASGAVPTSWMPDAGHAGSSASAPSSNSSTPRSRNPARRASSRGNAGRRCSSSRTRGPQPNPARRKCSWPPLTRMP